MGDSCCSLASWPQGPGKNGKQHKSSLESPIMLLTGHWSAVCTMKFNPDGNVIASGSHDKEIFLWPMEWSTGLYAGPQGPGKNEKQHKSSLESPIMLLTGMQLSPDGSYLLMNGMNNKLCIWDMRPFASQNRCVKIFDGHQHNFEKNL
ncbi:hypothetical protein D5086_024987 [Populus alba]|uniref:Uncharacterized protein n=1 Tax=Populus alba TaxID=43335 RepID=A0ACC4B8K5_POPAL